MGLTGHELMPLVSHEHDPHHILLIVLLGGGGDYYGYRRYGGRGLGGILGLVLTILIVLWLVGALGGGTMMR